MEANPEIKLLPESNRDFATERLGRDQSIFVGMDDGTRCEACGFCGKA